VDVEATETLPPELELALAYTPGSLRAKLRAYFALDQRLSRIVSATTEPMLGQMRLAWWRDMLGSVRSARPSGDAVLEALGEHWEGQDGSLVELVDSWEILVVAEQIGALEVCNFATGRVAPFLVLCETPSQPEARSISAAAKRWALADAAARVSDQHEISSFIDASSAQTASARALPRELRGLGVLDALGRRAVRRGGRPLMEGRGAALTALRAAIFRR